MKYLRIIKPYLPAALALAVFYGIGLGWGMMSEFSPSVDVPFPLGSLIFIGQYSDPTQAAKYPAFHYLVQLPFYGGVMVLAMITGNLSGIESSWPYGFRDPVLAFTIMQLISRGISLSMGIGLLFVLWRMRSDSTSRCAHLLAISLLALSGPFTFYAREANLEVPYNFWWVLAILFTWRYLFVSHKAKPDLLWAGLFSSISLATKDPIAGALVGLGLVILLISPAEQPVGWVERIRNATIFGLAAAAGYLLFAVLPQPARWWHHISLWTLSSKNVTEYITYPATPGGYLSLLGAAAWNLGINLSPLGVILLLLGLYILAKSGQSHKLWFFLLPALTYVVIIVMSIRFVYERFMLPVAVLWVPLVGIGAEPLVNRPKGILRQVSKVLIVLGVVFQAAVGYWPVTFMHLYDVKRQLANGLAEIVPPGSAIMVEIDDVARFPNADVYTRYRLMLPEGQKPDLRSEEHLYAAYTPGAHCLLANHLIDEGGRGVHLVASWEYPFWVRQLVMKQVINGFYLYDLDGQCQVDQLN